MDSIYLVTLGSKDGSCPRKEEINPEAQSNGFFVFLRWKGNAHGIKHHKKHHQLRHILLGARNSKFGGKSFLGFFKKVFALPIMYFKNIDSL